MRRLIWFCPRCAARNRLRQARCRRCRSKLVLARRLPQALLWAGALR